MKSIEIILNLYRDNKITIEEASQLIEDIKRVYYTYPYFTYKQNTTDMPDFKITCLND